MELPLITVTINFTCLKFFKTVFSILVNISTENSFPIIIFKVEGGFSCELQGHFSVKVAMKDSGFAGGETAAYSCDSKLHLFKVF